MFYFLVSNICYRKKKYNTRLRRKKELNNNFDKLKLKNENIKIERINKPYEIILLDELINDFSNNNNWINLIKVGNIYIKGSYPIFLPNKYKGLECFKLAMLCPDKNIAKLANDKYLEHKYNNISNVDNKGKEIPTHYADLIFELAQDKITNHTINNLDSELDNLLFNTTENTEEQIINNVNNNDIYIIDLNVENNYDFNDNEIINNDINDLQNVHDHTVNRIIISNIKKLQELYSIDDLSNDIIYEKIYNIILEDELLNVNQRFDTISVLKSLTIQVHEYFNISELDALKYIYKYINTKDNKVDLFHILNLELYNCMENGFIVCSTGKIGRIISMIDGIDNTFNLIKPSHIVREEILNLSNKIREEILLNATTEEKNNYDNSLDEILYNKMVNELDKQVNEIYIVKLDFNKEILNNIIEECKLGF
jgi:hypothetical protein